MKGWDKGALSEAARLPASARVRHDLGGVREHVRDRQPHHFDVRAAENGRAVAQVYRYHRGQHDHLYFQGAGWICLGSF